MIDSAPIVRPWKLPLLATIAAAGAVLAGQLERALVRLGAAVGEEHPRRQVEQRDEPFGQPHARLVHGEVGRVRQPADLRRHRRDDRRVRVPEAGHRDAADETRWSPRASSATPACSPTPAPGPRLESAPAPPSRSARPSSARSEESKIEIAVAPLITRVATHVALVSPTISDLSQAGSTGQKAAEDIAEGHAANAPEKR